MKAVNVIGLLICIGLIAGCSPIYGVKFDYNKGNDFSKYKTYDWIAVPVKATINGLVVERVKKAVDAELETKGLRRSANNPDFLIAEHLVKKDRVDVDSWGYGYGPYVGYWGGVWGPGEISTYHYEEGTLILDFVDAGSKKLVWRGTAKADVQSFDSPDKSDALIQAAVQKILKNYPPPSGS